MKLSLILLLIIASTQVANAKPFYYNTNWLPPRVHQICNDSFIGVEYNPRLEKRCRGLWTIWTEEIKNSISANQY